GPAATRRLYAACVVGAMVLLAPIALSRPWALLGLAAAVVAAPPVLQVLGGASGKALVPVLGMTSRLQLALGALLALGLAL
ncbi:MAG TPA: 1,4-dihydroxy-2-naphthoate polyprenyltransferase, partial [Acidimicrobiales bacterium]|nr:1,4-dihydroxy-2-naphthoate polyprenyltransferase [Acidimicrobiales bacterium]